MRHIGPNSEPDTSTERRATKRFRVKLPMTVRWGYRRTVREAQTQSEDISSRGVYFFLPTEIKKGSSVELDIVMVMPHEITLTEPIRIRCHGHVQRAEMKSLNRVGIAAKIERYELLRRNNQAGRRTRRQRAAPRKKVF